MPLRPELQSIYDAIVAAHPDGLTLNQLSDELVSRPVTYADIDELIGALEDAGFDLDGPEPEVPPETLKAELKAVLLAARELSGDIGQRPSAQQLAERTGLAPTVVLRALRFGRAIARAR